MYLSDAAIDPGSISMVNTPKPTDGHHLATVARYTVFNAKDTPKPIEAGATITYTPDFGVLTVRVTDQTGEQTYGQNQNGAGARWTSPRSATRSASTSTTRTTRRSLSGSVEAPVKSL